MLARVIVRALMVVYSEVVGTERLGTVLAFERQEVDRSTVSMGTLLADVEERGIIGGGSHDDGGSG